MNDEIKDGKVESCGRIKDGVIKEGSEIRGGWKGGSEIPEDGL